MSGAEDGEGKKKTKKPVQTKADKDFGIRVGTTVVHDRWKVVGVLGKGSFGCVYEVFDRSKRAIFAMKCEDANRPDHVLKLEAEILKRLHGHQHAPTLFYTGTTPLFHFLIMTRLDKNLSVLRRQQKGGCFSAGTSIRLGEQCLEGLRAVHSVGFIHRDVKPSNFVVGHEPGESRRTVFVLDFGLARQYVDAKGEVKAPRDRAGFRGTMMYASINCLERREAGRVDDLWGLLFMMVEFYTGLLPWNDVTTEAELITFKRSLTPALLLADCPQELAAFYAHLSQLKCVDCPNYMYLHEIQERVRKRLNVTQEEAYDWEKSSKISKRSSQVSPTPPGQSLKHRKRRMTLVKFIRNGLKKK